MRAAICTTILLGAVACHHSVAEAPDAGSPDSHVAELGLVVPWATTPAIPGASGAFTVTSAQFRVANVRLIGDAGTGDPRTSLDNFLLTWDASHQPAPASFVAAPSGLYSKVTLTVDGHLEEDSYDIAGTVMVGGVSHPFKVHDRDWVDVALQISTTLEPGTQMHVPIDIHLDRALGAVDWSTVYDHDGALDLATYDFQMPAFRDKLAAAFAVD